MEAMAAMHALRQQRRQREQLVERHREQWLQQWQHEQAPSAGTGAGTLALHHESEAAALASAQGPVRMTGEVVWLPGPSAGAASVGAEIGAAWSASSGRWPASPCCMPRAVASATTFSLLGEPPPAASAGRNLSRPPGAAATLHAAVPPRHAPAGQLEMANAHFLGREVMRTLSPRVNVLPVPKPPSLQERLQYTYVQPHDTIASALHSSSVRTIACASPRDTASMRRATRQSSAARALASAPPAPRAE